jgi:hypothetical protein
MEKRRRINEIRMAIKQQLGYLERILATIDALIACRGRLLAAGASTAYFLSVRS